MAEWKPIDELFDFEKGSLQSSKCTPGKYTFVTAAEEWKTHESYTHDSEALIFAMAASGSLGRTHYIKGKFIASDLCFILTPQKGLRLDLTFYYRLFNFLRSDIVKKTATGTSKLAINQTNFGAYTLPYFDYDHQLIFRDKIEKINSISESFSLGLEEQLSLLKQLRQAVLQEAIEGKLTAGWRKKNPKLISGENHAAKLLEKIKTEKERLIKEGKIKKEKPLMPITDAEKPFDLPEEWIWCRLGATLILLTDYHSNGSYAVLKKNVKLLDNEDYAIMLRTTNFHADSKFKYKYISKSAYEYLSKSKVYPNDIIMNKIADPGATFYVDDRGKPMSLAMNLFLLRFSNNFMDSKYTYYYLKRSYDYIITFANGTATQTITKDAVRELFFPFPPLAEQQAIVERVDKLMTMIDALEKQVTERKDKSERLMQSVLREAFSR
jgi:type I restriction enzyme S subunit